MRETSNWLLGHGLTAMTPHLVRIARREIRKLPAGNPIRSCIESHPEASTRAGLIDAFFNACENPLSPLQWQRACHESGLKWIAEGQNKTSSGLFRPISGKSAGPHLVGEAADPRRYLGALRESRSLAGENDRLRTCPFGIQGTDNPPRATREGGNAPWKSWKILHEYQSWLCKEVGPRVNPLRPDELLRGLSLVVGVI